MDKVKVAKVTRGYNLSEMNVRWLQEQSFKRTMKAAGRKVSDSFVLDELVTRERLLDERVKKMLKSKR